MASLQNSNFEAQMSLSFEVLIARIMQIYASISKLESKSTIAHASSSTLEDKLKEWTKKDAEALAKIHQAIADHIFSRIMNATTAKQAWEILQNEFQGTTKTLRPSKQVNSLFTHLVKLCIPPSSIDVDALPEDVQRMRGSLIELCGRAEGLLELEFATFLIKIPQPLNNLNLFPYYGTYVELADLENRILTENGVVHPKKLAFVGSGSMPLSSIVLATHHMKLTCFDNYDLDEAANNVARQIISSDAELERRMKFETKDIMQVKEKLSEYDCIFLAALVGMSKEEKNMVLGHIRMYMKQGAVLLIRSVKGAREFLYPVVDEHELVGFELLSIFHPTNDVINSVVLVRKPIF